LDGSFILQLSKKKADDIKSPARIVVVLASKKKRELPFPKILDANIWELIVNTGSGSCFITHILFDVVTRHISASYAIIFKKILKWQV